MSGTRLIRFVAASVSLLLLSGLHVQAQAPLRTAFVHLFEWRWEDIATECEQFLGPKGFAAVQVSPPNEHRLVPGRPWWERYQPVSYKLDSRSGDRAAFENMVQRCAAVGVKVYADAVVNHMTGTRFQNDNLWGTGSAGSTYDYKQYPNYGPQDFHQPNCDIVNYGDRHQVQNCNLVALADLNTGADSVRDTLAGFLNDLQSVGVAGFRIDAAKHMVSDDIAAILSRVNGSPEVYQEVIESPTEPIQGPEYFVNGLVTEFDYGKKLAEFFRNGNLRQLRTVGGNWQELMPSHRALVFVDNHDNQRGHGGGGGVLTHKDGALYDLANVFMLAWPYGYPRIMSSYAFSGDAQGPPNNDGDTTPVHGNGGIGCGNAWLCEHRRPAIANMVEFRNVTLPSWTVDNWWDNGGNRIAFGRGNLGFVVINRSDHSMTEQLQTGLAPGGYCDVIGGALSGTSCTGVTIEVHPGGTALLQVPAMTAVAIHTGQRPPPTQLTRTVIMIRGETVPGQDLFLRGGLDHSRAGSVGRNCTDQNLECAVPIRHRNLRNAATAGWKAGDHHLDWYGAEPMQPTAALGTPMDWTTNQWPTEWGDARRVATDGFGVEPLNTYGAHYWMLDVDMECVKTDNGWFEVKSFISNGPGWESDVSQPSAPWTSGNHFARCGYLNVFERDNAQPVEQRPLQP